jgi:integrase
MPLKLERPNYRLSPRGGIWYIDWTDPDTGKPRRVSTRQSQLLDAEVWRDQWLAGREQPEPPSQPRIGEILDAYVEARHPHIESTATLEISVAAIKHLVGNLEPNMLAAGLFTDRRRHQRIPTAKSRNSKRPGRVRQKIISDGTIRREGGVLRAALAWAVKEKWINPPAPHVELPPVPPPRERWLMREEVAKLIEACATPHVRLFVMLAYYTAARRGAILELTWDRVHFERRRIDYERPGRR